MGTIRSDMHIQGIIGTANSESRGPHHLFCINKDDCLIVTKTYLEVYDCWRSPLKQLCNYNKIRRGSVGMSFVLNTSCKSRYIQGSHQYSESSLIHRKARMKPIPGSGRRGQT